MACRTSVSGEFRSPSTSRARTTSSPRACPTPAGRGDGVTSVGLCLPQLGPHVTRSCVREFCASAEDLGFGGLWAQEHLFYPLDPPSGYHQIEGVSIPEQYQSVFS